MLSFYPILKKNYPEEVQEECNDVIMQDIRNWIEIHSSKSETAILGSEELVIEYNGKDF